jgi:hypothetical protein
MNVYGLVTILSKNKNSEQIASKLALEECSAFFWTSDHFPIELNSEQARIGRMLRILLDFRLLSYKIK